MTQPRKQPGLRTLLLLALAALAIAAAGLVVGHGNISDSKLGNIYLELRLYRSICALLVGAALGLAGALTQGLFRNPLASPSILGVSAGATLGAQLSLLLSSLLGGVWLFKSSPQLLLPMGAMLGGLGSLLLLLTLSRGRSGTVSLLLTGFLLSSMFASLGAFATSLSQEEWQLGRTMVAFVLGDLSSAGPRQCILLGSVLIFAIPCALSWSSSLNILMTGEEEAQSLGLNTKELKRWVVVWVGLLCGASIAVGGTLAFVGLVVPHVCRGIVGQDHRILLPASAIFGGAFLAACDLLARFFSLVWGQMPLGVVTGLIGAPTFLFLLLRSQYSGAFHE